LIGPETFFSGNCFIQMARIFITGSSDGLGSLSAKLLVAQGHEVVLHARNAERGMQALEKVAGYRQRWEEGVHQITLRKVQRHRRV